MKKRTPARPKKGVHISNAVFRRLRKSEANLAALIDTAADAIWSVDLGGRLIEYNEAFRKLISFISDRPVKKGEKGFQYVSEDRMAFWKGIFDRAVKGESFAFEHHYETPEVVLDTDIRVSPIRLEGNHIAGVAFFGRDISAQKRAEHELKESELWLRKVLDAVQAGIFIVDVETRKITDANPAALKLIGCTREEVVGSVCHKYVCPAEQGRCPVIDLRRSVDNAERVLLAANGEAIPVIKYVAPVMLNNRECLIESVIDISGLKKAELALKHSSEELRQAQKMDALGRLAGGVAHDFNNLLTSILGFSRLAIDELPQNHPVIADIEEVIQGAERAAKLTRQLLAFGRKQLMQIVALDLNTVVVSMDQLLRRILGEDIELVTLLGDELGSIKADTGCIEQIVLNLSINARDAMPRGGKLTIQTEYVKVDDHNGLQYPGLAPGDYVLLRVQDNGCGMSKEIKDHIFEPFFTTKGSGKGTGLGLSTVYGIVQQCSGHIELISEEGNGAEFRIYFPRVESPAEQAAQVEDSVLPGGAESVLVVEDDEAVRKYTTRVLDSLGYKVFEATNGAQALEICKLRREPFDLVLTDVVMPQMSGRDFIDQLRKTGGNQFKILYMTGFAQDMVTHHGIVEGRDPVLLKPFTRESLALKIRHVLDLRHG